MTLHFSHRNALNLVLDPSQDTPEDDRRKSTISIVSDGGDDTDGTPEPTTPVIRHAVLVQVSPSRPTPKAYSNGQSGSAYSRAQNHIRQTSRESPNTPKVNANDTSVDSYFSLPVASTRRDQGISHVPKHRATGRPAPPSPPFGQNAQVAAYHAQHCLQTAHARRVRISKDGHSLSDAPS